ncbi:MAG: CHC2 zinc finger domain-containing protein [Candidatus Tectomicrobia bacterium]|nr:CHC2 zinc finger domain-containing protein [Candidatus Tectomicrobia bacterium]
MAWVNYKEIKTCVKMGQVLERYGVLGELREKGDSLVGRCPIHQGSNANQFHVSRTKNNFMCFGDCHEGGNVIDFVVMMEGGSKENGNDVRKAAMRLQDWFGLAFERPQGGRRSPEAVSASAVGTASATTTAMAEVAPAAAQATLPLVKPATTSAPAAALEPTPVTVDTPVEQTPPPASTPAPEATPETAKVNPPLKFALKSLDPEHPYLAGRGLPTDTLAAFGVGYCTGKGIMAGRIAIPIHNEHGELVAYAGRWPGIPPEGEGKYKLPAGFHKSLVVYNLHRAQEHAKGEGLIVVEGFFDAMRLHAAGFPSVVALMGSAMSEAQEELLVHAIGLGGKIALMFDEDEAGWKGREDALSRLSSRVYVRVIGLGEEGTQPDSLSEEGLKRRILGRCPGIDHQSADGRAEKEAL